MWAATSDEAYNSGLEFLQKNEYERAAGAFHEAAKSGHAGAQFSLGELCEEGRGVPLSDSDAVGWYRAAADQGHASSQCNLAIMYEQGRGGLVASEMMAAQLFCVSAESGNDAAQFNLGIYYENGKGGMPKNLSEAETCFRNAAQQGNVDAGYSLANILLNRGERIEAMLLLKEGAKNGHALSSRKLASMTGDSELAMAATEDHTLEPLEDVLTSELHHGDVICVQFSVDILGSSFMHWALFDMENNQFIEFCGRRTDPNDKTEEENNQRKAGAVNDATSPKLSQPIRRAPPPRSRSFTGRDEIVSSAPPPPEQKVKSKQDELSWSAWQAFTDEVLNLPGIRGSSARFIFGSGTVTMSNAVVQATNPEDFVNAWKGHKMFRVVWTDASVMARGASAVLEARSRLGEVTAYNPLPRYGALDTGLNCESFVRQCLTGHARSAQAEALSGPDGGMCPVM